MQESLLGELKKLTKSGFNLDEVLSTASDLKYTREIKLFLDEQVTEPSQDFVRFLASQVYPGTKTQNVLAQFVPITKRAFLQFINDHISKRLKSALSEEDTTPIMTRSPEEAVASDATPTASGQDSRIETTEEELEGYHIVKALLREIVAPQRIVHRDTVAIWAFCWMTPIASRFVGYISIGDKNTLAFSMRRKQRPGIRLIR